MIPRLTTNATTTTTTKGGEGGRKKKKGRGGVGNVDVQSLEIDDIFSKEKAKVKMGGTGGGEKYAEWTGFGDDNTTTGDGDGEYAGLGGDTTSTASTIIAAATSTPSFTTPVPTLTSRVETVLDPSARLNSTSTWGTKKKRKRGAGAGTDVEVGGKGDVGAGGEEDRFRDSRGTGPRMSFGFLLYGLA